MAATAQRYTAVAIVLHWAIATAIVINFALGLWMHEAIERPGSVARAIASYQLHKSIGLTVLALTFVRLGWRLTHKPPPFPAAMPRWESIVAKATHWGFYVLLVAIPLSGWLYVSTQWRHDAPLNVPTLWFGLFEVPHLFGLNEAPLAARQQTSEVAIEAHELFAFGAIILLFLHVGAALKHHVLDRDTVLAHMVPGVKAPNEEAPPATPRRALALSIGFAAIALAAIAFLFAFFRTPTTAAPPPTQAAAADHAHDHTDGAAAGSAAEAPASAQPPAAAAQAPGGAPPAWTVDHAHSAIRFSGTYGGAPMRGVFGRWGADIRFDPANPDASQAVVTLETGAARTGISELDGSLSAAEAFDTANHPTAVFRTTRIRRLGGNNYEARGTLTLKGHALDVTAPFTLTISGDRATVSGRASIDRTQANVGMTTDPGASFVSREIAVDFAIQATRNR